MTLIIAHRGASAHAPENTMAAFRLALAMGAKAIELDVHQSRDNKLVVIHDENLHRVAGRKARVRDLTARELAGEGVPRLAEVLDLVEGKAELHVEIKKGSVLYPGIERRVVDLIGRRKAFKRVVVSSFDHKALFAVRALDARARLGYLLGRTPMKKALVEMETLNAESLNLSRRQADARKLRACREKGFRMLVYTINTQRELSKFAKLGVDGVFTNFPELKP